MLFHLVPYWFMNVYMAEVMGRMASFVLKVMEYARSFHANTKLKQAAVITVGLEMGIAMRKNALIPLHPSIFAASSSSTGMLKKPGRSISTMNGMDMVAVDKIGARYEFNIPSFEKIKNRGVSTREAGSIWVIRNTNTNIFIPFTRYLARP